MEEVVDGVLHWTCRHEGIGMTVHSHMHVPTGAVFDPLFPPGMGPDALAEATVPTMVLLSNRHHLRDAARVAEHFEVPILCQEDGLHEFLGRGAPEVIPFAYGDEPAPGVTALELGVLCPEDTVFRLEAGPGALLFADGLVRFGGELTLVPDELMGDDAPAVRRGLMERLGILAERERFDALLFAHGDPMPTGGHAALHAFTRA